MRSMRIIQAMMNERKNPPKSENPTPKPEKPKDNKPYDWLFNFLAGATAGVAEAFVFHPGDTAIKRMQKDTNKISIWTKNQSYKEYLTLLNKVVFRQAADSSWFNKWLSLYPGLKWAVLYKIVQRDTNSVVNGF